MSSAIPEQPARPPQRRFYRRRDWFAAGLTWLVAFVVYGVTLAPSVTLEDSGEFLTAAYWLGVPHPPGYPTWTMLAWLWQHLIPFGNIAWRTNLMSAFFSAGAAGLVALLVAKGGHVLSRRVGFLQKVTQAKAEGWIILGSAVSSGLMLAFAPVMWSQAVITEVYGLNLFLLMAVLAILYRWSFEPERMWRLYVAALLWGIGLTVHQTTALLVLALPGFVWFVDRSLGRGLLTLVLLTLVGWVVKMFFTAGSWARSGSFSAIVLAGVLAGAVFWLFLLWKEGPGWMKRWPHVLGVCGAAAMGLALYFYMPLAASTNPPMNWGHTQTLSEFVQHLMRSQYDAVHTERSLLSLWAQVNAFVGDLAGQFHIEFAVLALLTLFFYRDLAGRERNWLHFLLMAFLCLGLGFVFLSNQGMDKQRVFSQRVFFLPCHCIYALWIGYGLILGLGFVLERRPGLAMASLPVGIAVALLPVWSGVRGWAESEQRQHDFGYRFGYLMFHPGGDYPEMEKGAVLYGGTDPGRFVPTYLVYVESFVSPREKTVLAKCPGSGGFDRRDVYVLTQNALVDPSYLRTLRDQYGTNRLQHSAYPSEALWVPSEKDADQAFRQYLEEFRRRAPDPGEEVSVEKGQFRVRGMAAVMRINGILSKMIFERNKEKHTFYVEESVALPWMYPYLEPHGVILRLHKEPLAQLSAETISRDRNYWNTLMADLLSDPRFGRDEMAQATFGKLRAAIGGLYAQRGLVSEAEYAYRQALSLCGGEPDANLRLAQLYVDAGRYEDGVAVLRAYQKRERFDPKIVDAIQNVEVTRRLDVEIERLNQDWMIRPGDTALGLRLAEACAQRQRRDALNAVADRLLERKNLSQEDYVNLAQVYAGAHDLERVAYVLTLLVQRYPQNLSGWYNLAVTHGLLGDCGSCLVALERALALDAPGGPVHEAVRRDQRLESCRGEAAFQQMLERSSRLVPQTNNPPVLHFNR